MNTQASVTLRDNTKMPQLGFGVWQVSDDGAEAAVSEAFKVGYRSIDTAAIYRNEAGVGRAIKNSGLARNDMYITTKLWNEDQGYDKAMKAVDSSLKKLGIEQVDLYLVHWPSPQRGLYMETWKAMVEIKKQGKAKSIGVSNFMPEHLTRIIDATGEVPVLNQIELHPNFQQKELREFHAKHGIFTECWSPLGQGKAINSNAIKEIADKHGKTPAQVILRWHLQNNFIVIPKSVTPSRIKENFEVNDFKLGADDMAKIEKLDAKDGRIGPNPMTAEF
ncbi:aldo/keto reductase [Bdellovibrio sp. HCB209]|uniref:aldo/keto reductase n=1 Tax=Bdellovibrio sp. HCB209 TaxID=3394354 RepID=UPI0039B49656